MSGGISRAMSIPMGGYRLRGIVCGGALTLLTLLTSLSYAAGLRVGPSDITLKNVPVGALYDFEEKHGVLLKIYNDCDETVAYDISSLKSSEINNVPEGYGDIPDANWLSFEKERIEIEPHSVAKVRMYLKIPHDEGYYGKDWVVSVRVKSIPKAGQGISLACHPRIRIKTVKSKDMKLMP